MADLLALACTLSIPPALAAGAAPPSPRPLAAARAVLELSPAQAAERRPARLRGVVTYANPGRGDFFLHDGTGGVYVHPTPLARGLKAGDRVALEGVTDPGSFSPCLAAAALKVDGTAPLPAPRRFSLSPAEARWLDGEWVRCRGVVRRVGHHEGHATLWLTNARGAAVLLVPSEKPLPALELLLEREIEAAGVVSPQADARRQAREPTRVHVPSPVFLTALPDRGALPGQPTTLEAALRRFSPSPDTDARLVKVVGLLTGRISASLWFIENEDLGATVLLAQPTPAVAGDRFEVTGLMRVRGATITLAQASARRLPAGEGPRVRGASVDQVRAGQFHGLCVRLEARLEEVRSRTGHVTLTLRDGANRFDAYLLQSEGGELSRLEPGTRVAVRGVVVDASLGREIRMREGTHPGFGLLLRSAGDVEVVEAPPRHGPWTTRRVLYALAAMAALVVACALWVQALRVRLRRQAAQLRDHYEHEARLEDRLAQSQKMEAIGRLAGGIAHDFNNLLTIINGNSELAQQLLPADHPVRELIDEVSQAGEKAAALTAQLLLFSRQKAVELTRVDLNAAVDEAQGLLRRLIGEHINLVAGRATELPKVLASPGLIHQIVFNLAVNARDAMPRGGKLAIKTELAAGPAGRPLARLSVSDTGCGMSEQTLAHIFEPFFTTKETGKGTGLGLATVYGIVQSLGGEIRVRSAVGQGTTFEIDLPAAAGEEPAAEAAPPAPAVRPGDGVILLVEDEDAVRAVCRMALEMQGYQVVVADRPDKAIAQFDERGGAVDLVITDVVMPGMSGRDLARVLRQRRPRVRILYMSGYVRDDLGYEDSIGQELQFIQKPFTPTALAAKVREMLGGA